MRTVFGELTYTTLKRRVADEIQQAILTGTLHEGERIVERKLAKQFGASLTSVREALVELEAQGFVTKKPNFATYVIKFSPAAVEKMFDFRRIVEVYTIEEACRAASPEGLERLQQAHQELLAAAHRQDTRLYLQKDLALHEVIWRLSSNEYFEIALKRVVRPFFAFTDIRYGAGDSFDLVEDAEHHLAFVKAIGARDAEAAKTAYLHALTEWQEQTRAYVFSEGHREGHQAAIS